jgi:LmbE family N-acetylglucosaminyl deacetylase
MYEYIQPFINYSIPKEESLCGNKVLVIAPHQDDEAIGCAGTIIKHVRSGGCVETVFCTHDTQERMKESEEAASIIGSQKNYFMQFPVRSLYNNKDFKNNLISVINQARPEVVFIPFLLDKHDDHRMISIAFADIRKDIDLNFMVYAYSVWSPLNPNCLVDISDVWSEKKKVIECYKTQIATRDYVKIAQGLNQYWGEVKSHGMQYAETFLKATIQEYISLSRKIFR